MAPRPYKITTESERGRRGRRRPVACRWRAHQRTSWTASATGGTTFGAVTDGSLPLLFVDHPFPEVYLDLVDGRATVVGNGTDDGLDWNGRKQRLAGPGHRDIHVGEGRDRLWLAVFKHEADDTVKSFKIDGHGLKAP